jgi:8-oxo-dGTP diphosphatase
MIHESTFKKVEFHGAKGLVFLGDKILTYRRDQKTNHFPLQIDLPGGGREGDESPFETFRREVKEEFGIDIKEKDIESSYAIQSSVDPSKTAFFMVTYPLLYSKSDIILGDEGLEWLLMTPQEFIKRTDAVKRHQDRVVKYMKGEMKSEK